MIWRTILGTGGRFFFSNPYVSCAVALAMGGSMGAARSAGPKQRLAVVNPATNEVVDQLEADELETLEPSVRSNHDGPGISRV